MEMRMTRGNCEMRKQRETKKDREQRETQSWAWLYSKSAYTYRRGREFGVEYEDEAKAIGNGEVKRDREMI